tara:strand:- start:981 stop:1574 length:594 start_codon:yes stop_codon:yes gene_type:complete
MDINIKNNLRKMLLESVDVPTKLYVFDFDDTLIRTPLPEKGRVIWQQFHGFPFPSKSEEEVEQNRKITGWWGRKESLDMETFDMPMVPEVKSAYDNIKNNPDVMKIMLTGRRGKLSNEVRDILDHYGLDFDMYLYNNKSDTLPAKIDYLNDILSSNPSIVDVVLHDDRDEHIATFQAWGDGLVANGRLENFTMNHIK